MATPEQIANRQELLSRLSAARSKDLRSLIDPDAFADAPRVWIVGGGPSLRDFDFELLRGAVVIGVNRAFEQPHIGMTVSMDCRYKKWLQNGALGPNVYSKWIRFQGPKVFTVLKNTPLSTYSEESYYVVTRNPEHGYPPSWEHGMGERSSEGSNSGFMALQLAWLLGAKKIGLLGFDMTGQDGKQAWFHSGYPRVEGDDCYDRFRKPFMDAAPYLKRDGVQIINYCIDSGLKAFPRADASMLSMTLKQTPQRPLVIGYYTAGTGYEKEAREMIRSARCFGLECDVRAVENRGGWQANTLFKAEFVRQMQVEYPNRALLYVDVDARFRRYPKMFDHCMLGHFAAHKLLDNELLSGTLYFGPTAEARNLVDLWREKCRENPGIWDQKNLDYALAEWNRPWTKLSAPYCRIFDHPKQGSEPAVIEHMQASRHLKLEIGP